MTIKRKPSPRTSTPSQKLSVANSTEARSRRKRSRIALRPASPCRHTGNPRARKRAASASCARASAACDVKRRKAPPPLAIHGPAHHIEERGLVSRRVRDGNVRGDCDQGLIARNGRASRGASTRPCPREAGRARPARRSSRSGARRSVWPRSTPPPRRRWNRLSRSRRTGLDRRVGEDQRRGA